MGNEVTMSKGLMVTLVSMLVVFAVLILISYLIGLLKAFSKGKKKDEPTTVKAVEKGTSPKEEVIKENSEEIVVVIAAAIASNLGVDIPDINIQSIRRIPQNSLPWRQMGIQEQVVSKL